MQLNWAPVTWHTYVAVGVAGQTRSHPRHNQLLRNLIEASIEYEYQNFIISRTLEWPCAFRLWIDSWIYWAFNSTRIAASDELILILLNRMEISNRPTSHARLFSVIILPGNSQNYGMSVVISGSDQWSAYVADVLYVASCYIAPRHIRNRLYECTYNIYIIHWKCDWFHQEFWLAIFG